MKSSDIRCIENLNNRTDVFDVRWRVTTLCNYQCDFCIQGDRKAHLKQAEGESADIRGQVCGRLIRMLEDLSGYEAVRVSLIGGEVTILDDFPSILERLALCGFPGSMMFDITTNLSRDEEYYFKLCDIVRKKAAGKKRSLTIGASFYSAYETAQRFTEKLRNVFLYSGMPQEGNPVRLTGGVPILEDADRDVLIRMQHDFAATDVRIAPIFIRNYETNTTPQIIADLHEQREMSIRVTDINGGVYTYQNIQALGAELEETDVFCPNGYLCDAGVRNLWIDAFGNVKRCPAIGSTMSLGSILEGNVRLLAGPQACTSDHCSCSQYGRIEKK